MTGFGHRTTARAIPAPVRVVAIALLVALTTVLVACTGPVPGAGPAPDATTGASPAAPPAAEPADPRVFVCWGDSLSQHVCDPDEGGFLQTAFGADREVRNRAVGGQNSTEVAIRMGAVPITATFPDGVIPASGAVDVEIEGAPNDFRVFGSRVEIAGVEGDLRLVQGLVPTMRFERATAGAEVDVGPAAPVRFADAVDRGHPGTVWVGRNNVLQTDRILADVAAMVALHDATSDEPMWVVGLTPMSSEPVGSEGHDAIEAANRALRETYGDRYIPMDDYLRERALDDLGLTPTDADRAAVEQGVVPPALMADDGLHFDAEGRTAIASYLVQVVTHPEDDSLRRF